MMLPKRLRQSLANYFYNKKELPPAAAYDLWSETYDEQIDNPIIYLDDIIFNEIFTRIDIKNKSIIDIGCGTGRHWNCILDKEPRSLIGYDASKEMLAKLHKKYPTAKTCLSQDNRLKELTDQSCDLVISTLVIGYIKELAETFAEWNRVLKKNGEIVITDFHPQMLANGDSRSFRYNKKQILIKNHIHTLHEIAILAKKMNWIPVNLVEMKVDERIKHFYEKYNSIDVFNKTFNTPILYGYHFKKI